MFDFGAVVGFESEDVSCENGQRDKRRCGCAERDVHDGNRQVGIEENVDVG